MCIWSRIKSGKGIKIELVYRLNEFIDSSSNKFNDVLEIFWFYSYIDCFFHIEQNKCRLWRLVRNWACKNISGLQWFAHSVMLYKMVSVRAEIMWKIAKAKRNDYKEIRLMLYISLEVGCSLFYCCIAHNNSFSYQQQKWKLTNTNAEVFG